MAISSINFQKSKSHSVAETTRKFKAKYLLPEKYRKKNEYWNYKNSSDIKNIDLDFFNEELSKANRKGGKIPKFENSSWEAVLNLNENHNIDDVKKVLEHIEKKFNIKGTRIAIHKDEGNYNPVTNTVEYNYHAHLNFVTYKDGKQNWRLAFVNKDKLRDLQTEVAEILEMERGDFNSKSVRANHRVLRDNYEEIIEDREAKKEALEYKNKNMKNVIKGRELIKEEKAKSKKLDELLKVKQEEITRLMKEIGGFKRADFAEVEALKKELTNAKASEEQVQESYRELQEKYELKKKEVTELTNELHLIKCNEINLLEELEEIKIDVYSPDYKYEDNEAIKNIDVVKHLENENKKIEESLKNANKFNLELQELNNKLQNDLNSLREQNRVLEEKVTDLQEKIAHSPSMSDYRELKMMFNSALIYANAKIGELRALGKSSHRTSISEDEIREMMLQGERLKSKESNGDYDYNYSNLRER